MKTLPRMLTSQGWGNPLSFVGAAGDLGSTLITVCTLKIEGQFSPLAYFFLWCVKENTRRSFSSPCAIAKRYHSCLTILMRLNWSSVYDHILSSEVRGSKSNHRKHPSEKAGFSSPQRRLVMRSSQSCTGKKKLDGAYWKQTCGNDISG